jgi:hypothetical protein
VFRDSRISPVTLEGYPWPGRYSISPDEKWVLRTQKTGSGDNIGILYRIEKNGRVWEVIGLTTPCGELQTRIPVSNRASSITPESILRNGTTTL